MDDKSVKPQLHEIPSVSLFSRDPTQKFSEPSKLFEMARESAKEWVRLGKKYELSVSEIMSPFGLGNITTCSDSPDCLESVSKIIAAIWTVENLNYLSTDTEKTSIKRCTSSNIKE